MEISITYFFGLRMGVGMGIVLIYNQLLLSGVFGCFGKKELITDASH
jgi:hypothetical protein